MSRILHFSIFIGLFTTSGVFAAEPCDFSYVPPGATCSVNGINFNNDLKGSVRWTSSGNFIDVFNYDYRGEKCRKGSTITFYAVHLPNNKFADPEVTILISDLVKNTIGKDGFAARPIRSISCTKGRW